MAPKKTVWYGEVRDGRFRLDECAQFMQYMSTLPEGTRLEVIVEPEGKDVTNQQWRYLYSCVYAPFAEHFGWTVDEVDQFFKIKFCRANLIQLPPGLSLSKTSFDRQWLSAYIDFCRMMAANEGIITQEPKRKEPV